MYLEGSDQHRGWFHSSLLESCGTRGKSSISNQFYLMDLLLTEKVLKMSKSLGNVIAPEDILEEVWCRYFKDLGSMHQIMLKI